MTTYYTMAEAQRKTGLTANRIRNILTRMDDKIDARIPKSLIDAVVEEQEQYRKAFLQARNCTQPCCLVKAPQLLSCTSLRMSCHMCN